MDLKGYICKCFYNRNIFLKDLKLHIEYTNRDDFLKKFKNILHKNGITSQIQEENIIREIEQEVERRKQLNKDSLQRKNLIRSHYSPKHPNLYTLKESFLASEFLHLVEQCKISDTTFEDVCEKIQETDISRAYSLPVFSEEFSQQFLEEIQHFENSSLPKGRPNTMNKYGVLLDELGFDPFFTALREQYLCALTKLLYPDWGGGELDSHKVFVVQYREGEDTDLDYHYDNAEVTLNVSLTPRRSYTGGNLYFGAMRTDYDPENEWKQFEHIPTYGLLHRGQQRHGALPIETGERFNLILWMRASSVRNKRCPMCDKIPDLQEVVGFGDGFTQPPTVDVCSVI